MVHALHFDGVYVLGAFGQPAFFELPAPTLEDLNRLAGRIAAAVLDLLQKRGIWLGEVDDEDPVAHRNPALAGMARASIAGNLVFGKAGAKPVRLQDARPWVAPQEERAGKALGFVLDAEVRVTAHDRLHRERLCRYLLRPPLAKARLHETMDGRYALELKNPWPDGTRVIFFSGEELVARLTAPVPPPRMHLVHKLTRALHGARPTGHPLRGRSYSPILANGWLPCAQRQASPSHRACTAGCGGWLRRSPWP